MVQNNQKDVFSNLIFNIVIPTLILNKLSRYLGENGPLYALILALAFPLSYGLRDYLKEKKKNLIAILGLVNVLSTGGLALMKIEGIWFAVKEASFPLIIGLFVLLTIRSEKSFFELIFFNPAVFDIDKINDKVALKQNEGPLRVLIKRCTMLFSSSFFLSAALNYWLAVQIFVEIDPKLSEYEQSIILNEQIATMTWKSYFVIALPCLVFTAGILFYFFRNLSKITDLSLNELVIAPES